MRMMKIECMHSVNSVQCYAGRSEVEGGGGYQKFSPNDVRRFTIRNLLSGQAVCTTNERTVRRVHQWQYALYIIHYAAAGQL